MAFKQIEVADREVRKSQEGPTEREADCLDAIQWFQEKYLRAPTIREIGYMLDITSSQTASRLVHRLIDKGIILVQPMQYIVNGEWR